MQPISLLAGAASKTTLSGADLHGVRNLLVTAAGAALLVLLVLTTLSILQATRNDSLRMASAARAASTVATVMMRFQSDRLNRPVAVTSVCYQAT